MPRVGVNYRLGDDAVVRFAYARFMMPISNVRDTLGDFVNQYTGYAQTTTTLGLANGGRSRCSRIRSRPTTRSSSRPGSRSAATPASAARSASTSTQLRPQINDRFNVSFQKDLWKGIVFDVAYFFN